MTRTEPRPRPAAAGRPLIAASNVSFDYGNVPVLQQVDLQLAAGEACAIVGPSGCGKSTLLSILGGLLAPSGGTLQIDGEDPYRLDQNRLAAFRNQKVGFVFQAHHLLPQCTALDNVLVPTLVHPDPDHRATASRRAQELLVRVGLADRLHHRPAQLSGGECQRVAVVRALINRPRLLLADEPTGSLDGSAAERLVDLLTELNRDQELTLVMVTHAPHLAARMQQSYQLRDGRLLP